MAGTNKIATNKWIKDNLFIGYSIPGGQENNCPTKSEISKNSQNLISFKGGKNNQCMTQENLVTGVNTKTILFQFYNSGGMSYEHLDFHVKKPNGVVVKDWNWNPSNDSGYHDHYISLPIYGSSSRFDIYIEKRNSNIDDLWYKDSTCSESGGEFKPPGWTSYENSDRGYKFVNGINLNVGWTWAPGWDFDYWLSRVSWFRLTAAD